MKLYRIFLPKFFNDGQEIPEEIISKIAEEIREKFGGYTLDPHARMPIIEGFWKSEDNENYKEEMYLIDLFVEDTFDTKKWFKAQGELWRQKLKQKKLFIITQYAEVITMAD